MKKKMWNSTELDPEIMSDQYCFKISSEIWYICFFEWNTICRGLLNWFQWILAQIACLMHAFLRPNCANVQFVINLYVKHPRDGLKCLGYRVNLYWRTHDGIFWEMSKIFISDSKYLYCKRDTPPLFHPLLTPRSIDMLWNSDRILECKKDLTLYSEIDVRPLAISTCKIPRNSEIIYCVNT